MRLTKKYLFTTILAFASSCYLSTLLSASVFAWGPERATFTNDEPASYVTFNSITNNAAIGDERNFVRIGEAGSTAAYVDTLSIEPGKEYEVYIYYHNNASGSLNSSGKGIANGVKISSAYPPIVKKGEKGMVSGIVSATDSNPTSVWDEAYFVTDYDEVKLVYKTGTAVIHNAGKVNGSVLSTNLFTKDGVYIGINKLDGRIPGCAEYSGYITYTLVAEKTSSTLEKKVSLDGKNWSNSVTAKPGSYVTYQVIFQNTGNTDMANVIFKDTHSSGLSLRSGSTKIYNADNVNGKTIDDIIDISGYNTGTAAAGALVQITYQARVSKNKSFCGQRLNNTISAKYNIDGYQESSADVIVSCEEEEPDDDCIANPNLEKCQDNPDDPDDPDDPENPDNPDDPDGPNHPDNPDNPNDPDTPEEIVNTGPVEIVMAIIIVLGIGVGGLYYYRTTKVLSIVKKKVSGVDSDHKEGNNPNSTNG